MAGVGKASVLRMSGINSGLDTEAIVEAMTAATKLKITTNQRKVMKLEAQQEAYRGIMDKINEFKDKYFDILNSSTYLKGASGFNKFAAKSSYNGTEGLPSGIKITTNSSAIPGNYKVTVDEVATQSKYTSAALDSKQDFDLGSLATDDTYAMKITVGTETKVISFKGVDGDADATLANLNKALEVFGKDNNNNGLVYVEADSANTGNYKFVSLEKKAITTTDAVKLQNEVELGAGLVNGTNSITVTINGETKTISLTTTEQDYYKSLFEGEIDSETGYAKLPDDATDAEKAAQKKLIDSYEFRLKDMYQDVLGKAYESFIESDDYVKFSELQGDTFEEKFAQLSDTQKDIFTKALTEKQEEQWKTAYDKMAEALYDASPSGKLKGDEYVDWGEWKKAFEQSYTLEDFKSDRSGWEAGYNQWVEDEYDDYVAGLSDPSEADDFDSWSKDYKELYPISYYQDINSNWVSKYNEFASDEYDRYVAFNQKKFDDNPDNEGETYVAPDKTEWLAAYGEKFNVDDYKKMVRGSSPDVVVAEAEPFYTYGGYNEYNAYVKYAYPDESGSMTEEEYIQSYKDDENYTAPASFFNQRSIENTINSTVFADGTKLEVSYEYADTGNPESEITGIIIKAYKDELDADGKATGTKIYSDLAITANSESAYDFGLDTSTAKSNTLSTATKISELNLGTPDTAATYKPQLNGDGTVKKDANGNTLYTDEIEKEAQYKMSINGVDFTFGASTTISQMMSRINSSEAGVTMTFSSLTNTFEITNKVYGRGNDFTIDSNDRILNALGFENSVYQEGKNLELTINGEKVQTASNTYTIDGATFSFNSLAEKGVTFEVEVSQDTEKVKDLIKDFVKDYNELIKFVYGYVDEKPNKDYHFLTDDDKEEMALSENQEELWDKAAKKGLLYNDSTLTSIMSSFRTALYSAGTGFEEKTFGLFSLGISTSSNYRDHGLLTIDEDKFNEAFEKNFDDITRLFTNTTNGIMTQFDKIIEGAVKPTGNRGERGTLVDKAGVVNGASTTDNTIYSQIKSLNTMIDSLERRYEQQQDRYWSIYSALEQQMGQLNSQTSYISQLMGSS